MTDYQEGVSRPRQRIVDVISKEPSRGSSRRRRNSRQIAPVIVNDVPEVQHYPLEMQPVLRATLEYGRRTHALGAHRGAVALQELVDLIRKLGMQGPDIDLVVTSAEKNANELSKLLGKVYEDG